MASYYGQVEGNAQTAATRVGSRKSGIKVCAQSWDGSVIVKMYEDADGAMRVRLELADGSSSSGTRAFDGTMDELCGQLTGKSLSELC